MPLERIIEFTPAFDKRSNDPKTNCGIHGVNLRFILKGELGAIQFVVYTNWQLPHVTKEHEAKFGRYPYDKPCVFQPMPADLGYHSPKPMYEGQTSMKSECDVLNGVCYYDGSTSQAEGVFNLLCEEGGEAVWKRLEREYDNRFINTD